MNTKHHKEMVWTIWDKNGDRVGAVTRARDAALLVSSLGDGATVQLGCLIVWQEGHLFDGDANEDRDGAAEKMIERAHREKWSKDGLITHITASRNCWEASGRNRETAHIWLARICDAIDEYLEAVGRS